MSLRSFIRTASSPEIVRASLKISLVVGTVLNAVNQLGTILDGLEPSWIHVGLNYLVPYCVASYSAAQNQMRR